MHIRDGTPDDKPELVAMASATGVFKPLEIDTLDELLDDYFRELRDEGHRLIVLADPSPTGFAYFAPTPMTVGTWHLYWIAVDPREHGRGRGAMLLDAVEREIAERGGRVLFIETSALPPYDRTRRFYLARGYDQEATLRDFYAAGDAMVVFRKVLADQLQPGAG